MTREAAGDCTSCGLAVKLHFDRSNRMVGCVGAAKALAPIDRAKLFGLKIKYNHEARQASLKSIRELPGGFWQAKIGGAVRGRLYKSVSRRLVEQEIHEHYNSEMMKFIEGGAR